MFPVEQRMVDQSVTLRWFRVRVLSAFLMILAACSGTAIAEDGQTAEPVSISLPAASIAAEQADTDPHNKTTNFSRSVDETHDRFERDILDRVIRLDSFFGNLNTENQQKAEYQLRWRNSLRVEKGGQVKLGTTLRANIQLSRINERLNLVISGENEPEPSTSSIPEDPGSPGFDRNTRSMHIVNTELRYGLLRTPDWDIFLGAGVSFVLPPEAFVRGRFQHTYKFSEVALLRTSETLFVKNFTVPGETTEIDLERLINHKTLLRWATTGTVSSEITGMEWGTELSLIRELSSRSGISLTGGVYGNTSAADVVENYRIFARYRRNFLRSWLFYELEPEVYWPRRADGNHPTSLAFTFRIEVLFQGKEK
jgi:hypothetical protein